MGEAWIEQDGEGAEKREYQAYQGLVEVHVESAFTNQLGFAPIILLVQVHFDP